MADRAGPLKSPAGGSVGSNLVWLALPVLAALELAWFAWFEGVHLPNYKFIARYVFFFRAFPGVVPDVGFSDSFLGLALIELSHVQNLPQRIPIVLTAGLIVAAALGLGGLILRGLGLSRVLSTAERWGLAFGVGVSGLGVLTLLAGRLGWLAPWPVRVALGVVAGAEGVCLAVDRRRGRDGREDSGLSFGGALPAAGFAALAGPFLLMMALGSMLPAIDYDAVEYHLQGPKEYYQAGRITFLPHNVYTSMPFNVEMLHLLGMEVYGDWWWGALAGQFLVATHAPFAALMIALAARRFGSPRAAWFAAVIYLTTPWVYRLAAMPYVEGPLCYYHAALIWIAARAWAETDARLRVRLWGAAGLLASGAFACKYPALITAVIPFGLVALVDAVRRRSPRVVLAFVAGSVVIVGPWLAKNVVDTGNPVYPLAYRVFGGRHWDDAMDRKWTTAHGPRPIRADLLRASILEVAGTSDWQSPLYVALGPLAFLRRGSRRASVILSAYGLYLFLTWWLLTHRLDRFWLPLLPVLALLAGLGADWTRARGWSALLGLTVASAFLANLSFSTSALTALNEWTDDLNTLRTEIPQMLNPALFGLDEALPPGSKVLLVGEAAVFHFDRPMIYNTVFDDDSFETLAKGKTSAEVREALKRLGVTHVLVDWHDIDRFRSPGNYGFTPFVTQAEFDRLVRSGVLTRPVPLGRARRDLYRVR